MSQHTARGTPTCYHAPVPSGPLVSVSVDLDAVACYHRIHALPAPPEGQARFAILRRCLPRFAELFERHGILATFFVVGEDLEQDPEGRRLLAELAALGHELGNHSHTHPYDLTRLAPARIDEEVGRAHAAIAEVAGRAPVGFRAPGYETSATLIETLARHGYRYDSSAFPSTPYYLAKAAVMAGIRVAGRQSGSILGSPAVLRAPTTPYFPSPRNVYRRGQGVVLELPMAVTPWLRLPVIGTSLIAAPEWLRKRLVGAALARPFFNLELHGIDLADTEADGFTPELRRKQPDLRVPLRRKWAALDATFRAAHERGAEFATLAQASERVA